MNLLPLYENSNRIAITTDAGSYTYAELRQLVDFSKAELKESLKLSQGDLVGLCLYRTVSLCVTMISLVELGVAFLPISPSFPKERIRYIISDSGIGSIISDYEPSKKIIGISELKGSINLFVLGHGVKYGYRHSFRKKISCAMGLAYVMYTSGSTGKPKGVMISRSSMLSLFNALVNKVELSKEDTFLALTNYTFDISLLELLMPFYIGARIYLASEGTILKGSNIKKILSSYPISVLQATPTTLRILLESGWANTDQKVKVLCGGEQMSKELASALNCANSNVCNVYGPTETTIWSTCHKLSKHDLCRESIPIGRPFENTVLGILDANGDLLVGEGEGELLISGEGVAVGYLNNDELTAEKFINLKNLGRSYKTGDIVKRLINGSICYLGRIDDQIKVGGVRIEPAELECSVENTTGISKAVAKSYDIGEEKKGIHLFFSTDNRILATDGLSDVKTHWNDVFDFAYSPCEHFHIDCLSTFGWINSFTSKEITKIELEDNLSFLLSKLKLEVTDTVLEIGAGAGNLIKRVLPMVAKYHATDSSTKSVSFLADNFSELVSYGCLSVYRAFAHQINAVSEYECVILNSVIQYFPSKEYLDEVIDKAIFSVKRGGVLVIGDVRHADLLDLYVLEKIIKKQQTKNICSQLYLKSRDGELLVNPQYFHQLVSENKRVVHVDIHVKTGPHENDLNFYRYDVHIHIEKKVHYVKPVLLNWFSFDKNLLAETLVRPIVVSSIPNMLFSRILALSDSNCIDEIQTYASQMFKSNSKKYTDTQLCELAALFELARRKNVYIDYEENNPQKFLKMIIYPDNSQLSLIRCTMHQTDVDNMAICVREPYHECVRNELVNQIYNNIRNECPEYAHPSMCYWVEKWPVNESGKLNKQALDIVYFENEKFNGASQIEVNLIKMWHSITGSIFDNKTPLRCFGISSLYFSFFASMLYKVYGIEFTLNDLRGDITISDLAELTKIKADCV